MRKLLLLFVVLVFVSCKEKRKSDLPRLNFQERDKYFVVDSKEMLRNTAPLLGFNFIQDTLVMKDAYFRNIKDEKSYFYERDSASKSTDFRVFVDTSYFFLTKGIPYKNIPFIKPSDSIDGIEQERLYGIHFDKINALQEKEVLGLPLLIYNNSEKTTVITDPQGLGEYAIIQEALDKDGKWKPIEFHYNYRWCGTGMTFWKFLPKHYMAFGLAKYNGNFKTRLRVKFAYRFKVYYSNEFFGTINRSQFGTKPAYNHYLLHKGMLDNWAEAQEHMFLKVEASKKRNQIK